MAEWMESDIMTMDYTKLEERAIAHMVEDHELAHDELEEIMGAYAAAVFTPTTFTQSCSGDDGVSFKRLFAEED
jgi:hypothetical protein